MSKTRNIPVKRSFTAPLRSASMLRYATHRFYYETIYNGPEINSGSFCFFAMCNIARILTKCWPILQMLQALDSNQFSAELEKDRTRRTIDVLYSLRESNNYYGMLPFRLISILNSNGSSLLLYIILYIK